MLAATSKALAAAVDCRVPRLGRAGRPGMHFCVPVNRSEPPMGAIQAHLADQPFHHAGV